MAFFLKKRMSRRIRITKNNAKQFIQKRKKGSLPSCWNQKVMRETDHKVELKKAFLGSVDLLTTERSIQKNDPINVWSVEKAFLNPVTSFPTK